MRSRVMSTLGTAVLAVGLATTGMVGTANAAAPAPSAGAAGAAVSGSIGSDATPDAKTCDKNDNEWNQDGVTAQDFGPNYPELESEGAADFTVKKKKCKVGSVDIIGYPGLGGVADSITLTIYKDDGGLPGKEKCTQTQEGAGPDFTVTFTDKCKLKKGDYWLAAQVSQDLDTQGQWFWATTNEIEGAADLWRNPGGGFGTPCSDWGTIGDCIGLSYDYLYTINKK